HRRHAPARRQRRSRAHRDGRPDDRLHRQDPGHQRRRDALAPRHPGGHHPRCRAVPGSPSMNRMPLSLLFAIAPLAGCNGRADAVAGKAVLASSDGKYRVVHVADAQWDGARAGAGMESVLGGLSQFDLVYGHNDPMAKAAYEACKQKGRTGVKFVGIDGLANEGRKYVAEGVLDATFEYPTCADAAIDLALLAAK